MTAAPQVTVIAIGNPYRRDDGAGGAVLTALGARFGDDERVRLVELDGESVRLVQAWEGSTTVWIVDAVRSGRPFGSFHEIDATCLADLDDTGARLGGGHLLGLGEAVELATVLELLPPRLRVLGVEGETFENGEGLSESTRRGVESAANFLIAEVSAALLDP
ncbi:MAG: hydrogenase maturation protease [Actinobacteria bacterium]|nr:hydrogenase maturation protease [Actinomycetota bacterium]